MQDKKLMNNISSYCELIKRGIRGGPHRVAVCCYALGALLWCFTQNGWLINTQDVLSFGLITKTSHGVQWLSNKLELIEDEMLFFIIVCIFIMK